MPSELKRITFRPSAALLKLLSKNADENQRSVAAEVIARLLSTLRNAK